MGRTAELAQVQSWLSDAKIRSIGITGAGGYGKSMLLAKVCREIEVASSSGFLGQPFEQIVWTTFTESYRFESWGGWLLVQLLGEIPIGLTRSELIPALVKVLAQRRCLLVLDNAETLLTESGDWLKAEYGKFWLAVMGATSQSVLVLASQEQPNLPPNLLNCSRWLRLGGLDEAAGVALLQAWEVSGSDGKLREFVVLCDGHPLLMDVVVGNLKTDFELACIDDLPHANYELFNLIGLHRGDPMASLRAILAWSIARLPEELQGLILRLWIYPIRFNLVRLKDSYPDLQVTLGQCRQLARRSLLQERCQQRVWEFWFQPLIREYLQTRVLEDCRAKGAVWEEANTLKAIGDVLQFLDRRDEALERYDTALKLYEQVGANLGKANTLIAIGDVLQFLDRRDEALERYDTALKLYEQVGANLGKANTLIAIGDVLQFLDRREEALERYDTALKLYEQVGANLGKANTLQAIGDVLQFLKRCEEALERYDTALKLYEQVGDNLGEANTLKAIGDVLQFLKRCEEALEHYDTALKLYEQVGANLGKANTLQAIGDVLQFLKRCEEALEHYDTALKLYEQVGDNLGKANTLKAIGDVALANEQYAEALQHYHRALALVEQIHDLYSTSTARVWYYIGKAGAAQGNKPEAISAFTTAASIFRNIKLEDLAEFCERAIKEIE